LWIVLLANGLQPPIIIPDALGERGKATGGILTVYPMDSCGVRKDEGEGQYKGRSPKDPARRRRMVGVFY
jgi:hypothetical protein